MPIIRGGSSSATVRLTLLIFLLISSADILRDSRQLLQLAPSRHALS
jgi:hypothetical protein